MERVPNGFFYTGLIVSGLCLLSNILMFEKSDKQNSQTIAEVNDASEHRSLIDDEVISDQYIESIIDHNEEMY